MPHVAELYFKTAVVFFLASIAVGLQMAISGNHGFIAAHAHANLLGWVSMALFGSYLSLNPARAASRLAYLQYWVYTVGVAVLVVTLYFMLMGYTVLEPLAALSSLVVALGAIMFAVIIFGRSTESRPITGSVPA